MACKEAWARVQELDHEMYRAWQEELSLRPRPQLGQAAPVTPDEMEALRVAGEKYVEAVKTLHNATMEALRVNRLH